MSFSNLKRLCHTVEVYHGGDLVDGLYGVDLGGPFSARAYSTACATPRRVALNSSFWWLAWSRALCLLDTQFVTPHLEQFALSKYPDAPYKFCSKRALTENGDWHAWPITGLSGAEALETIAAHNGKRLKRPIMLKQHHLLGSAHLRIVFPCQKCHFPMENGLRRPAPGPQGE